MVGWVRWSERRGFWPKVIPVRVYGFPLLALDVPVGISQRRRRQVVKTLCRQGVTRALLPPELTGIFPQVSPLPLCRAMAPRLTLALLEAIPLRERRVILRGERADRRALALADALCLQVGELYLDFDQGGEELAAYLHSSYGVPPWPPGQIPAGGLAVEFSPKGDGAGPALRLWGEPDLRGLTLSLGKALPSNLPVLPFLTLLWESGRVGMEDILVLKP